jgi:hypothetical protein
MFSDEVSVSEAVVVDSSKAAAATESSFMDDDTNRRWLGCNDDDRMGAVMLFCHDEDGLVTHALV